LLLFLHWKSRNKDTTTSNLYIPVDRVRKTVFKLTKHKEIKKAAAKRCSLKLYSVLLLPRYLVFVIRLIVGTVFKMTVKKIYHLILVKSHIALVRFSFFIPVVVYAVVAGTAGVFTCCLFLFQCCFLLLCHLPVNRYNRVVDSRKLFFYKLRNFLFYFFLGQCRIVRKNYVKDKICMRVALYHSKIVY